MARQQHRRRRRKRPRTPPILLPILLLTSIQFASAFCTNPSAVVRSKESSRISNVLSKQNSNNDCDTSSSENKIMSPVVEKLLSPFAAALARIGTSEEEELRREVAAAEARLEVKRAELERLNSQAQILGPALAAASVAIVGLSLGSLITDAPMEEASIVKTGAGTKKVASRVEKGTTSQSASPFFAPTAAILSGAVGAVGANFLFRSKVDLGERSFIEAASTAEARSEMNTALLTGDANPPDGGGSKEITDLTEEIDEIFSAVETLQAQTLAAKENGGLGDSEKKRAS